jgi:hypothetical protein
MQTIRFVYALGNFWTATEPGAGGVPSFHRRHAGDEEEEILSNLVDRYDTSGEYPRSEHEQFLRLRVIL